MALVYSTALPLLKLSAALAKAAGVSFSLSAGIIGVLAVAGNRTHKRSKLCAQDESSDEYPDSEEAYEISSASDSEASTACASDNEVCESLAVSCTAPPTTSTAAEPAAKQSRKPQVHSSWAKLRRAFLASSLGPQQPQPPQQQQKRPGALVALKTTGLNASGRKAPRDKAAQDLSPTALRYRKFVKSLKSSFSGLSAKNRRKALAESKQSMLRTASSIQSRSSIMLTASSTGAARPAQGAIAAFYLPSKKQTPRRKQGGPWTLDPQP